MKEKVKGIILAILTGIFTILLVLTICLEARSEEISYYDIPSDYRLLAAEMEGEFQISQYVVLSLIYQESRFQTKQVKGNVCQVTNLKWFKEGVEVLQLTKPKEVPEQNVELCCYYLWKWFESDDPKLQENAPYIQLRCWNEGPENAMKNPSYISGYAKSVIDRANRWTEEAER